MKNQKHDVVQVTPQEHAAFHHAVKAFLKKYPAFINNLHNIKITRKIHYSSKGHIRKIFFPLDDEYGNKTQTFCCPFNPKDADKEGHSCTLVNHHGQIKMICPQNQIEKIKFDYYHTYEEKDEEGFPTYEIRVKRAAVYHYNQQKKEKEIVYKSTYFDEADSLKDISKNQIILLSGDLYWSNFLHRASNHFEKNIQLMLDVGANIKDFSDDYNREEAAWKILLALAEFQKKLIIHGDIKPANIGYDIHPHTKSNDTMAIRLIDLETIHIENTPSYTSFTCGYLAPELFKENSILSPELQTEYSTDMVKRCMNHNVPFTLASDLFAMAITLRKFFKRSKKRIQPSRELDNLLTQMRDENPQKRPDLAYCFGLTTTRNPALADYTLSKNTLSKIRYWGNVNRLLTIIHPQNPNLTEKMKRTIEKDHYFFEHISAIREQLESRWMTSLEVYALAYPPLSTQLYRFFEQQLQASFQPQKQHNERNREDYETVVVPPSPENNRQMASSIYEEENGVSAEKAHPHCSSLEESPHSIPPAPVSSPQDAISSEKLEPYDADSFDATIPIDAHQKQTFINENNADTTTTCLPWRLFHCFSNSPKSYKVYPSSDHAVQHQISK